MTMEKGKQCQHKWILVKHTIEAGSELVYLYCEKCADYIWEKLKGKTNN